MSKWIVEYQYPNKWIGASGNEAEPPPIQNLERVEWTHPKTRWTKGDFSGADYWLEINSLDQLREIALGLGKGWNVFIAINELRIIFTQNDRPD